jgi:hypothetical protein
LSPLATKQFHLHTVTVWGAVCLNETRNNWKVWLDQSHLFHTLQARPDWMAASESMLDVAIYFNLGFHAIVLINKQFKLGSQMPRPLSLNQCSINLVARYPSSAASNVELDAAIQSSLGGSDVRCEWLDWIYFQHFWWHT